LRIFRVPREAYPRICKACRDIENADIDIPGKDHEMCATKDMTLTKIDKLTLAMHRLASAIENSNLVGDSIEGQLHHDTGSLGGSGSARDLASRDVPLNG